MAFSNLPGGLDDNCPLPPMPDRVQGDRGLPVDDGYRVKIASTVDAELSVLLDKWRRKRGLTLAKAIDTALWHFFGRPKLSFELLSKRKKTDTPE